MLWILPSNAQNKILYQQTRAVTLSIYRSLLRTARQFNSPQEQWFLNHTIKERFRFQQCETSRKKTLQLLTEGDMALQHMKLALTGNLAMKNYIEQLASAKIGPLAHSIKKLRRIPDLLQRSVAATDIRSQTSKQRHTRRSDRMILPPYLVDEARLPLTRVPSSRRLFRAATALLALDKKEQRERRMNSKRRNAWKTYQVKKVVRASSGFMFIRRRGIQQSTITGMMMKNRAITQQKRLDASQRLLTQRDDLIAEGLFLKQLGVKNHTQQYLQPIHDALYQMSKYTRPTPLPPTID